MFYSQLLLSKKGALGTVWLAAHCHKRLKKDQVRQTDISSSVDKILDDEVPVVTHRILAFLLLGVVRIFSKKVEYLFHDSQEILNQLCGLKTGKSARACTGVSRTHYYSISLPKRFELDAFDLELREDQDLEGGNVRSRKQVMLADGPRTDSSGRGLLYKENISLSEAHSTLYTPPRDMLSPHHKEKDMLVGPSSNINISLASMEILRETRFYLEDRLEPMVLDESEKEQMHDKPSNGDLGTGTQVSINDTEYDSVASLSPNRSPLLPSLEMLHGTVFSLEDSLEPMVLDESDKEQMHDKLSNGDLGTGTQVSINDMEYDSVASLSPNRSPLLPSLEMVRGIMFSLEDRLDPMVLDEAEKEQMNYKPSNDNIRTNFQGPTNDIEFDSITSLATPSPHRSDSVASLGIPHKSGFSLEHCPDFTISSEAKKGEVIESRKSHGKEHPMSVTTPEVKLPESSVATPEVATVQTPAPKESAKTPKKRKTLLDLTTIVPNEEFKNWIADASHLKRERRKVPHTPLFAWRAQKFGHIPRSFYQPFLTGISIDLSSLECQKNQAASIEPLESADSQDDVRSPITNRVHEQTVDIGSPIRQMSSDQLPIAPGTPVSRLDSFISHDTGAVADSDEPTGSLESIEKRPSLSEGLPFDDAFQGETNSFEGDTPEKDTYSAKTRMTGNYLSRKFLDKERQKKEEVLNLSQLLEGKTKKESARLFYDILALKTLDCIDVQQENAYDDILLRETSKLKQTSGK